LQLAAPLSFGARPRGLLEVRAAESLTTLAWIWFIVRNDTIAARYVFSRPFALVMGFC
jgi:hypothetical protein